MVKEENSLTERFKKLHYRLVVSDMDGTLLDDDKRIPDRFWPLLEKLHSRGTYFAVASGRQLQTLQQQFHDAPVPINYIAENGGVVFYGNHAKPTTSINPNHAQRLINIVESHPEIPWGLVVCRVDGAYVTWRNETFLEEIKKYYVAHQIVDNLRDYLNDQIVKLSVYILTDAETIAAPLLSPIHDVFAPVIAGKNWVDVMNPETNKGAALHALTQSLGLQREQTIAFGDYLNDYQLLQAAGTAVAMENAHPNLKAIADEIAPSNNDHGVVQVLERLLGSR